MVILKGLKFVTLHYNMQLKKALKIFSVFLVYSLSFFNIILDLLTVLLLLLLVVISVLKIHPIFFFFFGLIHRFFYKTLQDIVSYFKLNISDTDISLFTYVIFVIFLAFFAYFFISYQNLDSDLPGLDESTKKLNSALDKLRNNK